MAAELGLDGSSTKVRRHGEVGDGSGGEDDDGELVEEPGTSRPLQGIINLYPAQSMSKALTRKLRPIMASRDVPKIENAAQSQSEPLVVRW